MDQLIGLAVIKTGVAAGEQLHNLSKKIARFFDSTDGAKKALSTWVAICSATVFTGKYMDGNRCPNL